MRIGLRIVFIDFDLLTENTAGGIDFFGGQLRAVAEVGA